MKSDHTKGMWAELALLFASVIVGFSNWGSHEPLSRQLMFMLVSWLVGLCGLLIQERRIAAFWKERSIYNEAFKDGGNFAVEAFNTQPQERIAAKQKAEAEVEQPAVHSGGY